MHIHGSIVLHPHSFHWNLQNIVHRNSMHVVLLSDCEITGWHTPVPAMVNWQKFLAGNMLSIHWLKQLPSPLHSAEERQNSHNEWVATLVTVERIIFRYFGINLKKITLFDFPEALLWNCFEDNTTYVMKMIQHLCYFLKKHKKTGFSDVKTINIYKLWQ